MRMAADRLGASVIRNANPGWKERIDCAVIKSSNAIQVCLRTQTGTTARRCCRRSVRRAADFANSKNKGSEADEEYPGIPMVGREDAPAQDRGHKNPGEDRKK